ncbi:alanine racemase [Aquibaculum arenosum]|uniref:Alanine racemase n=1 Tax=Aquibaculum arenosum TaxID=3032591 RepID=A0ABT5YR64_9PROT|nr:alanine racemase [Fodinicurvata sp. CAU 1616]MDF2097379.1 alanine racemase [Fodinicurvata sp. CAU 1616]
MTFRSKDDLPAPLAAALQPLERTLETLETPAVLVDAEVADANLRRWQARCDAAGLINRPHIKTHRSVAWAQRQIELGARGITVQTVGEAEVMVAAGITDIFLTTNVLGPAKLDRLAAVARRSSLAVVADSAEVVEGIAVAARSAGESIRVFVECDTGAHRCGLAEPEDIASLAAAVDGTDGLVFGGLMTYPAAGQRLQSGERLETARAACLTRGLQVLVITSGGSPDMWSDEGLAPITEYRAGTYIYNDRSLVAGGVATIEQCALTVLATVVSRPTADRAILDAGSKSLTSDLLGLDGHGLVLPYPEARLYGLSEEHGHLDVSRCATAPEVGERLRILPNHACVVSNLFDRVFLTAGDTLLGALPVDARGRSN